MFKTINANDTYLTLKHLQYDSRKQLSVKIFFFYSLIKIQEVKQNIKTGNVKAFTSLKGLTTCKPIFPMLMLIDTCTALALALTKRENQSFGLVNCSYPQDLLGNQ